MGSTITRMGLHLTTVHSYGDTAALIWRAPNRSSKRSPGERSDTRVRIAFASCRATAAALSLVGPAAKLFLHQRAEVELCSPGYRSAHPGYARWLYLAAILDLYSRKIVDWAMADHLRADLPSSVRIAISAQRPAAGLLHHSDRGVQYASSEYRNVLQSAGFRTSMSRKGDCYNNAPMESFFHTFKTQLVYPTQYATRAGTMREIFAYIEGFYNRTRRHSTIGYISPIEMELKAVQPCPFFRGKIKARTFCGFDLWLKIW